MAFYAECVLKYPIPRALLCFFLSTMVWIFKLNILVGFLPPVYLDAEIRWKMGFPLILQHHEIYCLHLSFINTYCILLLKYESCL